MVSSVFTKTLTSPVCWGGYEVMGSVEDRKEVADRFIRAVDARDRGGTKLNSPLELCVALDILGYSLIPFLKQHQEVRLEHVSSYRGCVGYM